jgi:26S proteasome regulatory subunit N10
LALKHRQNKAQRQRIIVFICSPVQEVESDLVKLAKKMKKNTISVDFIVFGDVDDDENEKKLRAFNEAVKGGEGSNLVIIPPSSKLLSDQLIATPVLLGDSAGGAMGGLGGADTGGGGGSGGGAFGEFDFDPSVDPELALALRMSMEEERARQEKKAREEAEAAKKTALESVQEEGENQPLLDKDGEPSGSGSSSKKDEDKGGKADDPEKMDTT